MRRYLTYGLMMLIGFLLQPEGAWWQEIGAALMLMTAGGYFEYTAPHHVRLKTLLRKHEALTEELRQADLRMAAVMETTRDRRR